MKDIHEYTAEVFKRSEKRIKERRKVIRRTLAVCVPLCLVVVFMTATGLPILIENNKVEDNKVDSPLLEQMQQVNKNEGAYTLSEDENEAIILEKDNDNINGGDNLADINNGGMSVGNNSGDTNKSGNSEADGLDSFSFSLTWNAYGVSSYDSKSGRLVKTTHATTPEDYVTTYQLSHAQKQQIYSLIRDLDVMSYPDKYDPNENVLSCPSLTLILTVSFGDTVKRIAAEDIAYTYESEDPKGQKFLGACEEIESILTSTEEWKALPEYEFLYE